MKREIKFRVWNEISEMFYPDGNGYFDDGKTFVIDGLGELIYLDDSNTPNGILMQFTGLKDKNGKEIYEGDILKSNKNDFYINGDKSDVYFLNGSFCISIQYDMIPIQLYDCDVIYKPTEYPNNVDKCTWLEEFEIIGNIYENSELLNK